MGLHSNLVFVIREIRILFKVDDVVVCVVAVAIYLSFSWPCLCMCLFQNQHVVYHNAVVVATVVRYSTVQVDGWPLTFC